MSNVSRWATIPTIRRQNVTTHSFFVAVMAPRIAAAIGWEGGARDHFFLVRWALLHDMVEAVTGDIPTPVKRRVAGLDAMERGFDALFHPERATLLNGIEEGAGRFPDIEKIVKFADTLEAVMFLVEEELLGNRAISETRALLTAKVRDEFDNLPFAADIALDDAAKSEIYVRHIEPLIDNRDRSWPVID